MIGTAVWARRTRRHTSSPSIPGSPTSSTSRAYSPSTPIGRRATVRHGVDGVPLALERARQGQADAVVVLGQQQSEHRRIVRVPIALTEALPGDCRRLTVRVEHRCMNSKTETPKALHGLVRDMAARAVIVVGLASIGVIHLIDAIGKYSETRYLFWMYIALIVGCIAVGGAVLFTRIRVALLAAALLAASAAVGYILSRTTGLPNADGDIGNWTEPLGLASLFVEGGVTLVAGAAYALAGSVAPARLDMRVPHPA